MFEQIIYFYALCNVLKVLQMSVFLPLLNKKYYSIEFKIDKLSQFINTRKAELEIDSS